MSLDDDLKKKLKTTSSEEAVSPNKRIEVTQREQQQRKEQLASLKKDVDRSKVINESKTQKEKAGIGNLKKEEVITADAKPDVKRALEQEQQKKKVEEQQGQVEQSRKTP